MESAVEEAGSASAEGVGMGMGVGVGVEGRADNRGTGVTRAV
jgi:hypothetical protein